ncbi:loganic acid O-methyltransferase-like [Argentina anserina]|uniref:loganic acid O-methyltransferase-like n=1 Tax=Argentina anserina TaxID=57926 RepID=UPI0021761E6E|nr:loganic acid O-methyltransferase-like [Potentilla anserina]
MAEEISSKVFEAHPMNGGDGPNSYAKNSIYQRRVVDIAKELMNKAILEKLDIDMSNTFYIADLGCSVGPNTFYSVENILETVRSKYQIQGQKSQISEFQVFFNDHAENDFNMLFKSLPQNRQYFAVGVPGSFHDRLFPNASIHIVHCSYAIQWLSRVPEAVVDSSSSAWNKGRIHYSNSTDEVIRAYETQCSEDMECFLHSRAQEIVYGGLIILTIPGRPDGTPHSLSQANMTLQFLGSCLMDMAEKGDVSEEKVDSFNIPMYTMSPQELKAAVERNGCFSIEIMSELPHQSITNTISLSQLLASHLRAGMEGIVKQHFGEDIIDELFDLYQNKCEENASIFKLGKSLSFLAVLRRIAD